MKFSFSLIRNRCVASAAVLLVSFNLSACSGKESKVNVNANPYNLQFRSEESGYIQDTSIPIRFNPNPKYVYEITLTIDGSPMPLFPYEESILPFDTVPPCRYSSSILYTLTPSTSIKVPIERVDANTYKTLFVMDAILDEDYGLTYEGEKQGVCHWKAAGGPDFGFSPTGQGQESNIGVYAFDDSLFDKPAEQFSRVYYYEKRHVTTKPITKFFEDGTPVYVHAEMGKTREELKDIKDGDLFTITVSGRLLSNQ